MKDASYISDQNRRQFMSRILPVCVLPCTGIKDVFSVEQEKHKFQKDFVHTYEEAFRWRFGYYLDLMEQFAEYLGREELIEMIKRANDDHYRKIARKEESDFSFAKWLEGGSIYANMMTQTIVRKTDTVYEINVTECIWERTYKKRNAADIGYATTCYSDFGAAKASNPNITLTRTKTLMEGHDCCDHCWTYSK